MHAWSRSPANSRIIPIMAQALVLTVRPTTSVQPPNIRIEWPVQPGPIQWQDQLRASIVQPVDGATRLTLPSKGTVLPDIIRPLTPTSASRRHQVPTSFLLLFRLSADISAYIGPVVPIGKSLFADVRKHYVLRMSSRYSHL